MSNAERTAEDDADAEIRITRADFLALLAEARMTTNEVASLTHAAEATVRRWGTGHRGVPAAVFHWVAAIAEVHRKNRAPIYGRDF